MNLTKKLADAALKAALLGEGPLASLFGLGGKNGGVGGLIGMGVKAITGKGFDHGGYTGAGGKYEPKGIVHGGEYVFSKAAVQSLGLANLEAMHRSAKLGYAGGGFVGAPSPASLRRGGSNGAQVVINNHTGQQVQQRQDTRGNTHIDIGAAVDAALAERMGAGGRGATARLLQARANRAHLRG